MISVLIETTGWIGDILFALSIPEKLRKENPTISRLDFLIDKPQPFNLVKNNKFIDSVYFINLDPTIKYDKKIKLPVIEDKSIAPTVQFQFACDIKNLSTEFKVDVSEQAIMDANSMLSYITKKKIITYQGDWNDRYWALTEKEAAEKKFDQTGLYSYYKTLRPGNMKYILSNLIDALPDYEFICIHPFSPDPKQNTDPRGFASSPVHYERMAAIISQSHAFLGAEGGLTNLSSGLGVKTIYTTCHMHRMFGEQGIISQCKDIQLGPEKLFPGKGHKAVSPFALPDEVIKTIVDNI